MFLVLLLGLSVCPSDLHETFTRGVLLKTKEQSILGMIRITLGFVVKYLVPTCVEDSQLLCAFTRPTHLYEGME